MNEEVIAMGARGPLAMPDNVRQIRGNPGKRATPSSVKAVVGIPEMPAWLGPEAKAEWRRVTPELERLGVISLLDRGLLTIHCRTWETWIEAVKKDAGSAAARYAAASYLATSKELGLMPSARLRMKAPEPDEPADPKSGLD